MEGHREMGLTGENFDSGLMGGMRDDDYESRSGSDHFDGASGDEHDAGDEQPQQKKKRKKYHRHTPQQIQELESFFKECPHPDEKQRSDLSKRLGLENKQVKFWFQNRRTQMKTHLERHENLILKQENEKLRAENSMMKEAMANPMCNTCGGPAIPGQISLEEHQIRIENARLKDELNRICALGSKFLGQPLSSMSAMGMSTPNSGLELGAGRNGVGGPSNFSMSSFPMGLEVGDGVLSTPPPTFSGTRSPMGMMGNEAQLERSMLVNLALAAMDELVKMAQLDSPLWIKSSDGGKEVLNHEEYARICSPYIGQKPVGYVTEASRETGVVMINSLALVDILMDADRWAEMFPSMITRAFTMDMISSDNGTRNGTLQLMHAEVQLPSPLVPVRQLNFLRFCKQQGEGVWVIVDVSVDIGRNATNANPLLSCRRLPSGCVVHDTPNGLSKITWVDHSQYDENIIHQMYRPLVNSGIGFGAHRWVATLQRQCECLALLMSPSTPSDHSPGITQGGKRSMLRLAQRMTDYFLSGVCASSACKWDILHIDNNTRFMSRKHVDRPGEASGIVISAATSVWLPVSRQKVFDFLREGLNRDKWDVFSSGVSKHETIYVTKGQAQGNCVSILGASNNVANGNDGSMLMLQDSWTDSSGSMIVYSPINVQSLNMVATGGDSAYVTLLPSGFAILPDGHSNNNCAGTSNNSNGPGTGTDNGNTDGGGCLLTFGLQMMPNDLPTPKLTMELVDSINRHISSTIQKIKMHSELPKNEPFFDSSQI